MQSKYRRNLWHLTRLVLVFRMDIADLFVWTNTVGLNPCYQHSDPVILHPLYTHPLASSIYEHWCQRHRFCIRDRYVDIKMEKGETVTSHGHLVVLLGFETSRAKSKEKQPLYSSLFIVIISAEAIWSNSGHRSILVHRKSDLVTLF